MKYLIPVFLCIFAISARAQIALEHTYAIPAGQPFGLVQVDSNEWKYLNFNGKDSIYIFNLDHSLEKVILVRPASFVESSTLVNVSKGLFSLDGSYSYLLSCSDSNGKPSIEISKDDGTFLFSCDTCDLGQNYFQAGVSFPIILTDSGTKLIIVRYFPHYEYQVYSLPGKLPSCSNATLGVTPPSLIGTDHILSTSAYPNPSQGRVRIAYQLPSGVSSGEVVLTDEEGREVKRYQVTNAFSDLEIQESDLPSGSYFYRLVTSNGESAAQRIVCEK
jgi:hypothetical protein